MRMRTDSHSTPATPRPSRGVTLIELMIGLAVLAMLLLSGAPAFSDWIRNTRIRSASESILNGIQFARTEAVRRNTPTRFQLVDSLDAQCSTSASGANWIVNLDPDRATSPVGDCDKDINGDTPPHILQKATATSSPAIVVTAERDNSAPFAAMSFNSVGQQIAVDTEAPAVLSRINITSSQGECIKPDGSGGTVRCLRVEITRGGQARLCDPGLADTPANRSMACEPS